MDQLTERARAAIEAVRSGPRGALLACFVPFVHTPEVLTLVQTLGAQLRYRGGLRGDLRELVILVVSQVWHQDFEWVVHQPIAVAEGLALDVVDDVAHGRRPSTDDQAVLALWDLATELQHRRGVSDAVYDRAASLFSNAELAEVFALIGYYTTLALTMNAVRTPVPPGPRLPEEK
ncbi:carboxymuconolactone decarboxylase family protein [Rhizomonospora bruguierae]|uniref:carboxymuconolactone decarboxylase family protein n=1 Tax=Rhizomonospora bruguierae TaxID=1581705 RepID=UPI001BCBF8D4|nr:carboxymuconolactone decarboxylase family protein [Micromonospora sp. NBRC 107566]